MARVLGRLDTMQLQRSPRDAPRDAGELWPGRLADEGAVVAALWSDETVGGAAQGEGGNGENGDGDEFAHGYGLLCVGMDTDLGG